MIWESKSYCGKKHQENGWAVLNGDDEHCIKIGEDLNCNVAYFSLRRQ
jgi:cyanophycin synthetase